jgi:Mn-dependent DtxR family transcriptional regulator
MNKQTKEHVLKAVRSLNERGVVPHFTDILEELKAQRRQEIMSKLWELQREGKIECIPDNKVGALWRIKK